MMMMRNFLNYFRLWRGVYGIYSILTNVGISIGLDLSLAVAVAVVVLVGEENGERRYLLSSFFPFLRCRLRRCSMLCGVMGFGFGWWWLRLRLSLLVDGGLDVFGWKIVFGFEIEVDLFFGILMCWTFLWLWLLEVKVKLEKFAKVPRLI